MTGIRSLTRLHDVAAFWSAGLCGGAAVIEAACDALADGADGHALAMLAALPVRSVTAADIHDVLAQALDDVALRHYLPRSPAADEAALAVMAHQTLEGMNTPRALAAWAHTVYGHDRLPSAERLAALDDVYATTAYPDLLFGWRDADVIAKTDADVIAEAHRIAEQHPRTA